MNRLVIIGNGFDLRIGLKSRFNDFFERSELPLIENMFNGIYWATDWRKIKDISFISFLLYNAFYRKEFSYPSNNHYVQIDTKKEFSRFFGLSELPVNWMDVESFIYCVLNSKRIKEIEKSFDQHFKHRSYDESIAVCKGDFIPEFFSNCLNVKQYFCINNFYDFFLQELHLFEERFSSYLKNEICNFKDYSKMAETIISSLTSKEDESTILNFNYTDISQIVAADIINVHGKLDSEIIIGIDDQETISASVIPFTKTFRKLVFKENYPVLTKKYDSIVIYGHSLGEQDYSYFQSIFDYLDIYNSNTVIKFVYSDYFIKEDGLQNKNAKSNHKIEMAQKLFKLLRSYGQTLNNKDNGQNLIHKLLLENRLILELNNFEELGDLQGTQQ